MQYISNPFSHLTNNRGTAFTVAIYWDFENVRCPKHSKGLVAFANQRGCLVTKRVYSHWQREAPRFSGILKQHGFELMNVTEEGKNSADRALIADCHWEASSDLCPDIFILLSGDKGFSSLVQELKQSGKYVIVIGFHRISHTRLIKASDEFYDVDQLCQLVA